MSNTKCNRECPHCHKIVSIRSSLYYFLRGTSYSIRCNHCHQKIKPEREPFPFYLSVCAGFFSVYLPTMYGIYILKKGFWDSALISIPFIVLLELIIGVLIIKRIKYIKSSWIGLFSILSLKYLLMMEWKERMTGLIYKKEASVWEASSRLLFLLDLNQGPSD